MMRCLVTGATGFVGRALVARLRASGHFVRGVARRPASTAASELVVADLADLPADTTVGHGIDVVFHLAARTHDMSEVAGVEAEYQRTNVDGTRRLLDAIAGHSVRRFVFVSSVKAIDEGNSTAADERTPERPLTPYGRSKLAAERVVQQAVAGGAFEAVCLRFPLVYGPGQRGNLQRMIATMERGHFPPPPYNGNRRSMLHVDNAVTSLLLAWEQPMTGSRTYIVTDARPYSTREIFDAVRAALGRPPLRWSVPMWGFQTMAMAGDWSRRIAGRRIGFDSDALEKLLGTAVYASGAIQRDLGYRPDRDLITSLPDLVADLRAVS
jgi:UDP-glucose 4-epimerase